MSKTLSIEAPSSSFTIAATRSEEMVGTCHTGRRLVRRVTRAVGLCASRWSALKVSKLPTVGRSDVGQCSAAGLAVCAAHRVLQRDEGVDVRL